MATPTYGNIISHPDYAKLTTDQKQSIAKQFWKDDENLAQDAVVLASTPPADLAPVQQSAFDERRKIASVRLAATEPEAAQYQDQLNETLQASEDRLQRLNTPINQNDIDSLVEPARNTGLFGSLPFENQLGKIGIGYSPEEYQEVYNNQRNATAQKYGLTSEQLDDVVRHQMNEQEKPVSRDALGRVHIKNDIFIQGLDSIKKSVESSDLPESVKKQELEGIGEKYQAFQESVVANTLANHKDYANTIGLDASKPVEENFKKIGQSLNTNTIQNEYASAVNAVRSGGAALLRGVGNVAEAISPEFLGESGLKKDADELDKRKKIFDSQLALSSEFNKDRLSFFGLTPGAVGQGIGSVAESAVIARATGGLIPRVGGAGQLAGYLNSIRGVAPTAAIMGTRTGLQTYEDAKKQGLNDEEALRAGLASGVIEAGTTLAFTAAGAGGVESIASGMKKAVGPSVKSAFAAATKDVSKNLLGEVSEESIINALDQALVQTTVRPGMTTEEFVQSVKDTAISTLIAAGPLSAAGGVATYNQTNAELRQRANQNAQENLSKTETEGGNVETPSNAGLVEERTRLEEQAGSLPPQSEERLAVEERIAEIDNELPSQTLIEEPIVETEVPILNEQESVVVDETEGTPIQETVNDQLPTSETAPATQLEPVVEEELESPAPAEVPTDSLPEGQTTPPDQGGVVTLNENVEDLPETTEGISTEQTSQGEVEGANPSQPLDTTSPVVPTITNSTNPETTPVSTPSRVIAPEEETVMRSTNASLDRSLKKYGLEPVARRAPGKLREWWNQAVVEVTKDPTKGVRLTNQIVSKPRAINELELNTLAYTRATQEVQAARTREEINAAEAAGNTTLAQSLNARIQTELGSLQETATALKIGTSTAGKVLRASQVGVDENYSLTSMQNRVQAEINVGKPLAKEQNDTIRDLNNRIKEAEEEGQVAVIEAEARVRAEMEKYYTELLTKEARPAPRKRKGPKTQSERLADIERSIADASARLRKKLNQFGSGPDVTIIGDLAVIGVGYLRKGFLSLQAYRDEMKREYGDEMDQYAEQAYKRSQELLANSGLNKTPQQLLAEIDPSKPANRQTVWNMAKAYAGQGLKASELVDKVHTDLKTKWKGITRDMVTNLINDYGQSVKPTRSALQQELADLRRYAALTQRIEDLKAGKPAVVRKREKPAVNEEIRQLEEQAKELVKATKLVVPKDPLAAAKTRLRKEADALDTAVRNNELIQQPQRTAQTDTELETLKARRDQAKKDYDEAFPEQGTQLTPNQEIDRVVKSLDKQIEREEKGIVRDLKDFSWFSSEISERRRVLDAKREARNEIRWRENAEKSARTAINKAEEIIRTGKLPETSTSKQRTPTQNLQVLWDTRNELQGVVSAMRREGQNVTNLQKSIAELERRIAEKDFSAKPRKVSTDPQIIALRETRKELQKTFSRLKNPPKTKEDRIIDAINKRTESIRERIAKRDFSKEIKATPQETDRILKARLEEFKAKEEWNHLFFENNLKNASAKDKAIRIASQPIELLRTWKTMFDLPPIFRQGIGVLASNPSIAVKAWPKSFVAGVQAGFGNDTLAKKAEMAIRDNPQFDLFNAAGLAITQSGQFASLKTQEEEFRGSLIKKIPGLKQAANYSEANYVTFLNELRIGLATQLGNYLTQAGSTPTLAEAKVIADYVNNVTGRGSLRGLEGAANTLSAVFFSPRYWASRLNFLAGGVRATWDVGTGFKFVPADVVRARKAVAREYAKVMIGYGLFYGSLILAAAGYNVPEDKFSIEWNPISSDFGKVKIGKTRIDPLGGLAGHITFISRAVSFRNKTLDGETYFLPDAKGNQQSYFGIISNYFVRTKLAPIYGSLINVGTGKDVVGKKSTVRSEIAGTFLPLSVTDIAENFEEYGPAGGVGLSFFTLLGAGTNTYDDGLTWPQRAAVAMGEDPSVFQKKSKKPKARLSIR